MRIYFGLLDEPCEAWEGPEYKRWMSLLLRASERHEEVADPGLADAVLILESNKFKGRSSTAYFENSRLIERWAGKVYTLNYSPYPVAFLPGLYVSLPAGQFRTDRHAAIPYPWSTPVSRPDNDRASQGSPRHLVSFRGAPSHSVRRELAAVMLQHKQLGPCALIDRWFNHSEQERRSFVDEITDSKFVLCPRGLATSTFRLYEVMMLGRVPVIISDDWVPPLGPDWQGCSIRVAESRISELPQMIRHHEERWEGMAKAARQAWLAFCAPETLADTLLDGLEKLTKARNEFADMDALKRFWRSNEFARSNRWNLQQRLIRLLRRLRTTVAATFGR
jgi:hypothetical protein